MTRIQSKGYLAWIDDLKHRYRATQIKAAIAVNSSLIEFYWNLGRDIFERSASFGLGNDLYRRLSADLKADFPQSGGFSAQNLKYCLYFYRLYAFSSSQQLVDSAELNRLISDLVRVPWGHHVQIVDKCKGNREKAIFYVRRTIQNGWSRNTLLAWIDSDLYASEAKAQTNFALTMPSDDCDLARQLVRDPQVFEVFGLAAEHRESELKTAIVANIERTLLSLGRGVAFVGREYPVEVGGETKYIDLLFYIIPLHRYLVMEVKTSRYEPADLGQLCGYLVMAKNVLNTSEDKPPIGLLVCRDHNRVLAKYQLEAMDLPMGITNYELKKMLPSADQWKQCFIAAENQVLKGSTEK